MRPGFGPIFPRVRTGIRTDKALGPVGRRPVLVMLLQGLPIVDSLIPEQGAERVQPWILLEQALPIIVATLMPDMAQERAGGLVELLPPALALDVVGLRHMDGDHPIGV